MDETLARLATFALLPASVAADVSGTRLSKLGFYYSSETQALVCFRCRHTFDVFNELSTLESHRQLCSSSAAAATRSTVCAPHQHKGCHDGQHPETTDVSPPIQAAVLAASGYEPPRDETHVENINTDLSREHSEYRNSSLHHQPDFERLTTDETARLSTFREWPQKAARIVEPRDLAKAGLFYTGQADRVQCAFCRGYLYNWVHGDRPADEHRRHFPDCKFIRQLKEDNNNNITAAATSSPRRHLHQNTVGSTLSSDESCSKLQQSFQLMSFDSKASEHARRVHPRHNEFLSEFVRLKSFERGHVGKGQNAQALAKAGFFYAGPDDRVQCFQCGGGLKNWKLTDDPWTEHQRWFPLCPFISAQQDLQSPDDNELTNCEDAQSSCHSQQKPAGTGTTGSATATDSDVTSCSAAAAKDDETVAENRRLKELHICRVCMDLSIDTVFLPCGHLVCCSTCSHALRNCPICRSFIRGTVKAFFS